MTKDSNDRYIPWTIFVSELIGTVLLILICMMLAPQYPGMTQAAAICLAIMMVLDFLVMYFIDLIMKTPGLMIVLTVLGSVPIFVQACLAIEIFLTALKHLGTIKV